MHFGNMPICTFCLRGGSRAFNTDLCGQTLTAPGGLRPPGQFSFSGSNFGEFDKCQHHNKRSRAHARVTLGHLFSITLKRTVSPRKLLDKPSGNWTTPQGICSILATPTIRTTSLAHCLATLKLNSCVSSTSRESRHGLSKHTHGSGLGPLP